MPPVDVTIRYLELDRAAYAPKRTSRAGVGFAHVTPPQPELNRFFYTSIGGEWFWLDRRAWSAEQWAARVARGDELETWILSVDGAPAGFVELERQGKDVDIAYFGLLAHYAGQGLGAHMLTCAVDRALAMDARNVTVNTCSLDHPRALANYTRRGFREVRQVVQTRELPERAPSAWDGVHDPMGVAAGGADGGRALLRHMVAVVAYRGGKTLRGAPASFARFAVGPTSREPIRILAHIGDLYDWALSMARGAQKWTDTVPESWDAEVARFFGALRAFDEYLASDAPLKTSAEQLAAGPVADSLAHIGQLAMLRRVAGAPIKGENYARADIVAGRVGPEQSEAKREFD